MWILTHASDFARGLVGLLGRPDAIGEAFHVTSDEVLTWNQIHETIADALGVAPRLVHIPSDFIARIDARRGASLLGDKAWSVVFDTSKLRRVVPGYEARVPFAEGVRASIAWLEADPARQRIDANEGADESARRLAPGHGHSRVSHGIGMPPLHRSGLFALAVLMGACGGGGVSPTGPLATPAPTATAVPLPTILDGITGAIVPGAVVSPPTPGRNERVMVTATGYLVREQLFVLDPIRLWPGSPDFVRPDRVLLGGHGPGDRDAALRGDRLRGEPAPGGRRGPASPQHLRGRGEGDEPGLGPRRAPGSGRGWCGS